MREILLKFANGGSSNGVLTRDNIVGLRTPYLKPGNNHKTFHLVAYLIIPHILSQDPLKIIHVLRRRGIDAP